MYMNQHANVQYSRGSLYLLSKTGDAAMRAFHQLISNKLLSTFKVSIKFNDKLTLTKILNFPFNVKKLANGNNSPAAMFTIVHPYYVYTARVTN